MICILWYILHNFAVSMKAFSLNMRLNCLAHKAWVLIKHLDLHNLWIFMKCSIFKSDLNCLIRIWNEIIKLLLLTKLKVLKLSFLQLRNAVANRDSELLLCNALTFISLDCVYF